jgi:hypothetical protein
LSGRDGFEVLSPSRRASSAGFAIFVEVKYIFFTTPEDEIFFKSKRRKSEKKQMRKEVTGVTGRWTGRDLGTTGTFGQWQLLCTARGSRVCNRRVWSLAEPERLVTHPGNSACLRADRTR